MLLPPTFPDEELDPLIDEAEDGEGRGQKGGELVLQYHGIPLVFPDLSHLWNHFDTGGAIQRVGRFIT